MLEIHYNYIESDIKIYHIKFLVALFSQTSVC